MKRELKRQIKEDELVSGFERAWAIYGAHRREVHTTALVLVALAAAGWGTGVWRERRAVAAEAAFGEALETFNAPVASELPEGAPRPAGTVFATAAERYAKATAAFDGVERAYGSHPVGLRARYMSAICRLESGDTAQAQRLLSELAKRSGDGLEPGLARLALAELLRRTGQTDQAVDAFRQIAEEARPATPRDHALMGLAATLEDARRFPEARASYKRLADEFPGSVYAAEARRRAEFLETAGGE